MPLIARRLLTAGVSCSVVLVAGCKPPTESVQWGYRGNSMIQVYNPDNVAELADINAIPEPEPSDPYDPTFPMATELHENVQVLTDLNALELARLMNAMTTWIAPEEGCAYCHNTENLADDSKYTKLVARQMLKMTRDINANWKSHVAETGVTCWTCHRGQAVPSDIWFKMPDPPGPSAGVSGWKGGQNLAGVANNGNAALPFDPLTAFLQDDTEIRVQGTGVLPTDNRKSIKQAENTYALMMYMSKSLGVNCTYCHQTRAMGIWEESTPQRVTAWYGIRMVRDFNQEHLKPLLPLYPEERLGPEGDAPKAACATCHKGSYKPLYGQSMLDDYPSLRGVLAGRMSPDPTEGGTVAVAWSPEGAVPASMEERTRMAEVLLAAADTDADVKADAEAAADAEPAATVADAAETPPEVVPDESAEAEMAATEAEAPADIQALTATAGPDETEVPDVAAAEAEADETEAIAETEAVEPTPAEAPQEAMEPEAAESGESVAETEVSEPASAEPAEPEVAAADTGPVVSEPRIPVDAAMLWALWNAGPAPGGAEGPAALAEVPDTPAEPTAEDAALAVPGTQALLGQVAAAPALPVEDMTVGQVESALSALLDLLDKLQAVRAKLDAAASVPRDALRVAPAPSSDEADVAPAPVPSDKAEGGAEDEGQPTAPSQAAEAPEVAAVPDEAGPADAALRSSDTDAAASHAAALAAEVDRLRAELQARAAESAGAEASGAALAEAEARIVAMQARLAQETRALEQQLELVREQRDRAGATVAAELRDAHADAIDSAETRLRAMQARLDQQSTALRQQLAVVRDQRDDARAEGLARVAQREHAAALAEAERQITAIEARLGQQTHALHQQLEVVREQRDEAHDEIATRIPADEHQATLDAAERKMTALRARLAQQTHALGQQLAVVRGQRAAAEEDLASRIPADEHHDALDAAERQMTALGARLAQQTHALDQQLAVVREQREMAMEEAAARVPADEHAAAVAALEARLNAVQARLDQNLHALNQQLRLVRNQRDGSESRAAAKIAQLRREHADALVAMEERIAAREVRLAQERQALNQQLEVVRRQRDLAAADAQDDPADGQTARQAGETTEAEADTGVTALEARALADAASALGGEVTDEGIRVALGGDRLRFASGSATLPAEELPDLDRAAKLLAERPELVARVEGHTDSVGSRALNQSLSQQRAESVMAALEARGVDPARLSAVGVGPDRPVADNTTAQGRSQNRRVEIYVTAREQVAAGADSGN